MKASLKQWWQEGWAGINLWLGVPMLPEPGPRPTLPANMIASPPEPKHACKCGGHCHKPAKPAALTDEQQVILSAWNQFAYRANRLDKVEMWYTGGLSALEEIEGYLQEHDLIDENGIPRRYE